MNQQDLQQFLNEKVQEYNVIGFVENDPVSIPHRYKIKQDIEITALWAAVLSWGRRKTIIDKCTVLFDLMDNAPYEFVLNHQENDLKRFLDFKHRTFNATDTLYFISFFRWYYQHHESLEEAFADNLDPDDENVREALVNFHHLFFSLDDFPERTRKHIATPERNSACKRINMFLRWMVRKDNKGVDFGIWERIKPSQLVAPCDVHVDRIARKLGLISRKQTDWTTAVELTNRLKKLDPSDPVKYDFALFGLGVESQF